MAVTETLESLSSRMRLSNGQTSTGAVKTVNVSLGTLDKNAWDPDKAMAIANALEPCLDKSIYVVDKVATSTLSN